MARRGGRGLWAGGWLWLAGCGAADEAPELQAEAQAVVLAGPHAVGAFTVTVGDAGGLSVTHADTGARSLFATATGSPLELARASLTAVDRQGSFRLGEQVETACVRARFSDAREADGALVLSVRFDDATPACAALSAELSLREAAPGQLAFALTSSDESFDLSVLRVASRADERIYGMGEQAPHDTLDLKGRVIDVLAQEGGIGRGHVPITPAVDLVSSGSGGSEGSAYYAAPHYLTSDERSLFLENDEYAQFDFRAQDVTLVRAFTPRLRGRILAGRTPLELVERFTAYAGRMPALPDWANEGAIVALAKTPAESLPIVDALRARGALVSAVWNQTWSGVARTAIGEQVLWNWVQNPVSRPGFREYVAALGQRGIRTLCYVNPMLRDVPADAGAVPRNLYREALAAGFFVRRPDGTPYLLPITAFEVGLLDLTNEGARRFMKDVLRDELIGNAGCAGWMGDFGEALPFDAVLASGATGADYHNRYTVEWAKLQREAIAEVAGEGEILFWNRSGHTRTPGHAMLLWQGDQLTTWDKYDGLVSALRGLLNGGLSGLALNHSDTGGYTSLSRCGLGYRREAELLKRWTEMNAFTAVLRTHEGNQPGDNPQVYSDAAAMDHFARFTRVYRALAFYRKELFAEASTRGAPVVRHLMLHYPDDARSLGVDDEFLLGSEILVAPVKNKCWTPPFCPYDKAVYLPPGRWVHLWTSKVYGQSARGVDVTVKAPIGEPAVFYREGSRVGATFVANLRALGITVR